MNAPSGRSFNFAKLVVADLDRCATFYQAVFKLEELARVEDAIAGRPIHEVMYKPTHEGAATFVLLAYKDTDQPALNEAIIGFTVTDLDSVLEAVDAQGGRLVEAIREMPHLGIRVAFAADPEGHLIEIVQMLG